MRKRIGLIGASTHLVKRILPALEHVPDVVLFAIASRDTTKAKDIAKQWNIPLRYDRYEDLLENPEIEAVYISTPPALHFPWIKKALSHNKHVLCEKPLVLKSRELRSLFSYATHKQKILMPAWMYRFHPQWHKLKEILSQNLIGEIRLVDIRISYETKEKHNIRYNPSLGGGVLNDIGCYALSSFCFLFNISPHHVFCKGILDPLTKVDVLTTGILSYHTFQATFTVGMEMQRYQRLLLFGSQGMIDMEYPFHPPPDQETHLILSSSQGRQVFSFPPLNLYSQEWKIFVQSMESLIPPLPQEEIIRETILLEKCHLSLRKGQEIVIKG
ncbi:MAG: Gfo/Idh/MocA family oxidoreductase [Brevinematales bacterium]|nr:Gfo/Idh/MocA family oxidoreductase [Brevinematales bacterium]